MEIICKAGMAILVSDRIDFGPKLFRRHKESHYILISGVLYRESIVIVNTYVPNVRAPNFIKQTIMDTKGQMGPNRIIVSDSIPHSNLWIGHPIEKNQ